MLNVMGALIFQQILTNLILIYNGTQMINAK